MYIFVLIIHVIVCFVLVFVVLLQAGRGGGFSDMMGGGQPQSIFGTQTNAFMMRATEVCAIVFILTSLVLGVLSTQRGKSLVEREMLKKSLVAGLPKLPAAAPKPAAGEPAKTIPAPAATMPASAASSQAPSASGAKPAEANAS